MRESDYLHANKETVGAFMKVPALKHFGGNLREILSLSKIRQYGANELIIEEGDNDRWIFCLISGSAQVVKGGQIIGLLQTGDIFGEMSIIDGSARSATVRALEETVCLATDISRFNIMGGGKNELFLFVLYRVFATFLAGRLRETNEHLLLARREIAKLKGEKFTSDPPPYTPNPFV